MPFFILILSFKGLKKFLKPYAKEEGMHHKIIGLKKLSFSIFVIILALIVLGFLNKGITLELGIIGSIVTFIYGFFINSLFKFVEHKYTQFKLNLGMLSANLQSLYNMVLLLKDEKLRLKVKSVLVRFITSLKDLNPDKYGENQGMVNELFQSFNDYKIKSKADVNIHSRILQMLCSIASNREELEIFGYRYLAGEIKLLFMVFPILLGIIIFTVTKYNVYVFIIGLILIAVLIVTSVLILDMDNLSYGDYRINKENLTQLLKFVETH